MTWQAEGLRGSALGPLFICYGYLLGILAGLLTVGMRVSLTPSSALGTLFLLLSCLSQP